MDNVELYNELSRFRDHRRRLLGGDGDYDDATLREAVEGLRDLHDAIGAAVRSALEDEEAASRLRGRLDELDARLRRVEKRAAGKRETALRAMLEASLEALEAPGLRVAVRRAPPVVMVSDESLVPEAFRIPQRAWVNYRAIREALEGGAQVPGAALSEAEPYLSVRTD